MSAEDLPALNASLNTVSTVLLVAGYLCIRQGWRRRHRNCMLAAVLTSALFLVSYCIYHARVGSVPYPLHDWSRSVYFTILVPHILLAAAIVPLVLVALYLAARSRYTTHARVTRWLWPLWVFVSVSGVAIYLMLYQLAGATVAVGGAT